MIPQIGKSMADETAKGIHILSNILKDSAFLHQGVTSCVFRKLFMKEMRHKLSTRSRSYYFVVMVKQNFRNCSQKVFGC